MKTCDFLDAIRLKHGLRSDYMLAKVMNVPTQHLSHWRHGKNTMGDDACMKVAELLQIRPEYVLASVAAERAKSDSVREAWERAAVALAACLVLSIGAPAPVEAKAPTWSLYIMSTRRRTTNRGDRRRRMPFGVCTRTLPLPLMAA